MSKVYVVNYYKDEYGEPDRYELLRVYKDKDSAIEFVKTHYSGNFDNVNYDVVTYVIKNDRFTYEEVVIGEMDLL